MNHLVVSAKSEQTRTALTKSYLKEWKQAGGNVLVFDWGGNTYRDIQDHFELGTLRSLVGGAPPAFPHTVRFLTPPSLIREDTWIGLIAEPLMNELYMVYGRFEAIYQQEAQKGDLKEEVLIPLLYGMQRQVAPITAPFTFKPWIEPELAFVSAEEMSEHLLLTGDAYYSMNGRAVPSLLSTLFHLVERAKQTPPETPLAIVLDEQTDQRGGFFTYLTDFAWSDLLKEALAANIHFVFPNQGVPVWSLFVSYHTLTE